MFYNVITTIGLCNYFSKENVDFSYNDTPPPGTLTYFSETVRTDFCVQV